MFLFDRVDQLATCLTVAIEFHTNRCHDVTFNGNVNVFLGMNEAFIIAQPQPTI